MPSIVFEFDIEPEPSDRDEEENFLGVDLAATFKVTSPEGTDDTDSPDAACDLIVDLVEQQFWDWYDNPERGRRFKPRLKVYEVRESC